MMGWMQIDSGNYTEVQKIYQDGLNTGIATFETQVPSWSDWDQNHLSVGRIALTEHNIMVGWGALSKVSSRLVYRGVAEVSIYIADDRKQLGYGRLVLDELIDISEQNDIWTLQSSIFALNTSSIKLHEKCGFRQVGIREKIAQKGGKWYDTVLMERRTGRW